MHKSLATTIRGLSRGLIAAAALLGAGGAAAGDGSTLASLSGGQDIQWEMETQASYAAVVLRVAGPDGFLFEAKFSGDPELDGPLADGQYNYELYLVPTTKATSGSTKGVSGAVDANGRPLGSVRTQEGEYTKRGAVQSGTFAIQHGLLVDPDTEEG